MRADTGMPFWTSFFSAFNRFEGGGAKGSRVFAVLSFSVVIVMDTMLGVFLSRSMSLVTSVDFVII